MTPRYHNSCKSCRLILQYEHHDMYYCEHHGLGDYETRVVRISDINTIPGYTGSITQKHWRKVHKYNLHYRLTFIKLLQLDIIDKCELDRIY